MALKSTIHKVELSIADMDRNYYETHQLTVAQHPSETEERMMVRILAFARHAHDRLFFGKDLSVDDEPALWQKDYTEAINLWIDVGLPDEKRIRKASGRSEAVAVYLYGGNIADMWWEANAAKMRALDKVSVYNLPDTTELTRMARRNMTLQCTIQDGEMWLSDDKGAHLMVVEALKAAQ